MRMKRTLLVAGLLLASANTYAAELTLFGQDNFRGERLQAHDAISNLANSGFNDRASSVVIRDGAWQLCDDAYFRGRCVTLQPGRYPSLREIGLSNRVSSARENGSWGKPPAPPNEGQWGGRSRAVLFSNPDFRGEQFVVDGNVLPDLANIGFNDRAQSLRVERGYWIFCSDADFQGECRLRPRRLRASRLVSTTGSRPGAASPTTIRTTARRTGTLGTESWSMPIVDDIAGLRRILLRSRTLAVVGLSAAVVSAELFRRQVHAGPRLPDHSGQSALRRSARRACYPDLRIDSGAGRHRRLLPQAPRRFPPIARRRRSRSARRCCGCSSASSTTRRRGSRVAAGLDVVMNRCVKIEHARILGGLNWAGVNTGVISRDAGRV